MTMVAHLKRERDRFDDGPRPRNPVLLFEDALSWDDQDIVDALRASISDGHDPGPIVLLRAGTESRRDGYPSTQGVRKRSTPGRSVE